MRKEWFFIILYLIDNGSSAIHTFDFTYSTGFCLITYHINWQSCCILLLLKILIVTHNCDIYSLHWCKNSVFCFYILEIYLKGTENSICLHFHQEFLTDIFGGKWQLISQAIFLSIGDNFIYTNCREDPVTPWQYASARGQQGVTTQNLQQSEDRATVLSVDLYLMHSAQRKSF